LPQPRLLPRFKPVAFLPLHFAGCAACFAPLWECSFPPDQRLASFATFRSAFRNCPIFDRSPQPFHLSFGYGSSFPIRYISAGLLFLKPLGTFLNMILSALAVNVFLSRYGLFQQLLFDCISNQLH